MGSMFLRVLRSQFLITPPYPTQSFAGQTCVVTGANIGLGLEAARHLVRLDAEKVILAVRTVSKGEEAKKSIEESTGRTGVVEVWALDLSSYESTIQFAERLQGLKRLDCIVENAGIATEQFQLAEENESTITTNVVSTFLLALLVLPKLRETATKFNVLPRLVIVSSDVHEITSFPERKGANIFETLNKEAAANMSDRYNVSKLLDVFGTRALAESTTKSGKPRVIVSTLNPGLCHSALVRNFSRVKSFGMWVLKGLAARTTEVGARTLVAGAAGGEATHGKYMQDGVIAEPSAFVRSAEGAETQKRVWQELTQKLESIRPGILGNV
ncbi:MAG: hypothetical protein M1833_003818 [Piccolia ochrophora]|nr:MAG: hypothetical protein M1833_003818 [Piccolia ochrophora]